MNIYIYIYIYIYTLTFDCEFYLQIKGMSMGTIFAPTFANVTMGYHKNKVYSIIRQSSSYAFCQQTF